MHEWALAEAVASTAIKIADKEKIKHLTLIKITIGELRNLDTEILKFAINQFNSSLKKTDIKFTTQKSLLKCRVCNHKWDFSQSEKDLSNNSSESIHFIPELAHTFVKCPDCGSTDFEVLKGQSIWIESIEGIK